MFLRVSVAFKIKKHTFQLTDTLNLKSKLFGKLIRRYEETFI